MIVDLNDLLSLLQLKIQTNKEKKAGCKRPRHINCGVWTTAAGDEIAVCKMDDDHLFNAIRSTERWADREVKRAIEACEVLGSMFGVAMTADLQRMLRRDGANVVLQKHPSYSALVREASCRGLI